MAVETAERVEVVSEPLTYRQDAPRSYFRDLIDAEQGDTAAKTRLERHGRETQDELERRDRRAFDAKPEDVELRVNPNRTQGKGGFFAPPLWLIDRFATLPRAGRALADLIPGFELPQGVGSVSIPRLTTGTQVVLDQDGSAVADLDVVDAQTTSAVVTIAGQGDVSLQVLDQSPPGAHLDWAFFKDLNEAYDAQLEYQLINGQGTGKTTDTQLSGVLQQAPSSNTKAATASTATGMFGDIGKVGAAVGINRLRPPEVWLMTTPRLMWLGSSEDQQQRPLMITDKDASGELDLLTLSVKLDDAIPRTLGTGGNQDVIIACIPSDMVLMESTPRTSVMLDVLSGTLQARLQLHRYVAALTGRYPSGIGVLNGSNMAVPTGF